MTDTGSITTGTMVTDRGVTVINHRGAGHQGWLPLLTGSRRGARAGGRGGVAHERKMAA